MSYRNYLYEIDNEKLKEIENFSVSQLNNKFGKDDFIWLPDMVGRCLFEYGSMSDFHSRILEITKPLFLNEYTHEYFNAEGGGRDIVIVDKEILLTTIEMMREEVAEMYKNYADDPTLASLFFKHRAADWANTGERNEDYYRGSLPYNLYDDETASDASHYEYAIFELVRLFKTIDSENKTLVYMGY